MHRSPTRTSPVSYTCGRDHFVPWSEFDTGTNDPSNAVPTQLSPLEATNGPVSLPSSTAFAAGTAVSVLRATAAATATALRVPLPSTVRRDVDCRTSSIELD